MINIILFVVLAIYLWYSCKCVTYMYTFQTVVKKHMLPSMKINYFLPAIFGLIFGGFIMMFFSEEMHKEVVKSVIDPIKKQIRQISSQKEDEQIIDNIQHDLQTLDISFYCPFFSKK